MILPSPLRTAPHSGHYAFLATALLAFIVLGSLAPFHFRFVSWSVAEEIFWDSGSKFPGMGSRSDFLANILLFIPFAYVVMGALCVDYSRLWALGMAIPVAFSCAMLSMSVEFAQVFFPPRDPSLNDVFAQCLGTILGISGWLTWGQGLNHWCRSVWAAEVGSELAGMLLPAYLILLTFLHLLPLDLSLSPVEVYHKYRRGWIHLIPFVPFPGVNGFDYADKSLCNVLYFYPLGVLGSSVWGPGPRRGNGWLRALILGLVVASAVELMQLFVLSSYCDVTDILTGTLAVLAGWATGLHVPVRFKAADATASTQEWSAPHFCSSISAARWPRSLAFVLWMAVVLFVNWHPFYFTSKMKLPHRWVPFVDYYDQYYFHALDQLIKKTLLFLPGGILFGLQIPFGGRKALGFGALCLAVCFAGLVEFGQLFLPARFFSLTDIVVEIGGFLLGFTLASHARSSLSTSALVDARNKSGSLPVV